MTRREDQLPLDPRLIAVPTAAPVPGETVRPDQQAGYGKRRLSASPEAPDAPTASELPADLAEPELPAASTPVLPAEPVLPARPTGVQPAIVRPVNPRPVKRRARPAEAEESEDETERPEVSRGLRIFVWILTALFWPGALAYLYRDVLGGITSGASVAYMLSTYFSSWGGALIVAPVYAGVLIWLRRTRARTRRMGILFFVSALAAAMAFVYVVLKFVLELHG